MEAAVKWRQFGIPEANTAIATALPCRITVYTERNQTALAMIRPTTPPGLFNEPGLQSIACKSTVPIWRLRRFERTISPMNSICEIPSQSAESTKLGHCPCEIERELVAIMDEASEFA